MKAQFKASELLRLKEVAGDSIEVIKAIQKFKVEIRVFKIDDNGVMKYVICGGMESLFWFEIKDLLEDEIAVFEGRSLDTLNILDNLPFVISNVRYDIDVLEKILKWKDVKTLSNDQVEAFGTSAECSALVNKEDFGTGIKHSIPVNKEDFGTSIKHSILVNKEDFGTGAECSAPVTKEDFGTSTEHSILVNKEDFGTGTEHSIPVKIDLEDKIVYLHERNPSTNTLSLSKQFELKHFHVQQFIFKGIEFYPSVLASIDIDIYRYEVGNGAIAHSTYLTIGEVAYQHFLESMGTPKSYEMRVLRFEKKREYYDGFMALRENMYALGFEEREIRNILKLRTRGTNALLNGLYTFGKQYSASTNTVILMRIVFNIINHRSGIHAITRSSKINRNVLSREIQDSLFGDETLLLGFFKSSEPLKDEPLGVQVLAKICIAFDITSDEAMKMLTEYECGHLIEAL